MDRHVSKVEYIPFFRAQVRQTQRCFLVWRTRSEHQLNCQDHQVSHCENPPNPRHGIDRARGLRMKITMIKQLWQTYNGRFLSTIITAAAPRRTRMETTMGITMAAVALLDLAPNVTSQYSPWKRAGQSHCSLLSSTSWHSPPFLQGQILGAGSGLSLVASQWRSVMRDRTVSRCWRGPMLSEQRQRFPPGIGTHKWVHWSSWHRFLKEMLYLCWWYTFTPPELGTCLIITSGTPLPNLSCLISSPVLLVVQYRLFSKTSRDTGCFRLSPLRITFLFDPSCEQIHQILEWNWISLNKNYCPKLSWNISQCFYYIWFWRIYKYIVRRYIYIVIQLLLLFKAIDFLRWCILQRSNRSDFEKYTNIPSIWRIYNIPIKTIVQIILEHFIIFFHYIWFWRIYKYIVYLCYIYIVT